MFSDRWADGDLKGFHIITGWISKMDANLIVYHKIKYTHALQNWKNTAVSSLLGIVSK